MGVDRWLAILGAQHLMPNLNLIIVDAGTATTVDILTSNTSTYSYCQEGKRTNSNQYLFPNKGEYISSENIKYCCQLKLLFLHQVLLPNYN